MSNHKEVPDDLAITLRLLFKTHIFSELYFSSATFFFDTFTPQNPAIICVRNSKLLGIFAIYGENWEDRFKIVKTVLCPTLPAIPISQYQPSDCHLFQFCSFVAA
jgi:hypothetical protein